MERDEATVWPGDDAGLLAGVVAHYRSALTGSVDAAGWLERRKIADPGAVELFGVGFADRSLGKVLPAKSRDSEAHWV